MITITPSAGRYAPLSTPKPKQTPSSSVEQSEKVNKSPTNITNAKFSFAVQLINPGEWKGAKPAGYYEIVQGKPGQPNLLKINDPSFRAGGINSGPRGLAVNPEVAKKFENILSPKEYDLALIATNDLRGSSSDLKLDFIDLVYELEPELEGTKQQPAPERDFNWYTDNDIGWGETVPGTDAPTQKGEAMTYNPREDFLTLAGVARNYLHYVVEAASNLKGEERARVLHNAVESGEWSEIKLSSRVSSWENKGKPDLTVHLFDANPSPFETGRPTYTPGSEVKSQTQPTYYKPPRWQPWI